MPDTTGYGLEGEGMEGSPSSSPVNVTAGKEAAKQIKDVKAAVRELGDAGDRAATKMAALNKILEDQRKQFDKNAEGLDAYIKEFKRLSSDLKNVKDFASLSGGSRGASGGSRKSEKTEAEKRQEEEEKRQKRIARAQAQLTKSLSKGDLKGSIEPLLQLGKEAPKLAAASSSMLAAVGVIGALAGVVALLGKAGIDASKSGSQAAKAMTSVGKELGTVQKRSLSVQDNLSKLGNKFSNLLNLGGDLVNVVFEPLLKILNGLTAGIPDTEDRGKVGAYSLYTSSSAKQSGFSLGSADALATGTYNLAQDLTEGVAKGEKAYDVARKLADAWLSGSDAAKEYGVVVNDTVLAGYMASKGVDIVNVEITEAMRQYYRYQLLTEEVNSSNKKAMQDQIKQWTQLGMVIDKTKGKLFSFDEVINLEAFDTAIPEVPSAGAIPGLEEETKPGEATKPEDVGPFAGTDTTVGIGEGLSETLEQFRELFNHFDESITNFSNTANTVSEAVNKFGESSSETGQQLNDSSNTLNESSNNINMAADTFANSSASFEESIATGAEQMGDSLVGAATESGQALNSITTTGVAGLTSSSIEGIGKAAETAEKGIVKTGEEVAKGIDALTGTTETGNKQLQDTTKTGKKDIGDATSYGVGAVGETGTEWQNKIEETGQSILEQMAAYNQGGSEKFGDSSNSEGIFSRIGKGIKGRVAKARSQSNAKAGGLGLFDIVTEGSDLLTSLKQDDGSYDWAGLPRAVVDMAINSVANPLETMYNWGKLGQQRAKQQGQGLLGQTMGALSFGALGGTGYSVLETLGDLGATAELVQDATIGGYNKLTGSSVSTITGLTNFNNAYNQMLVKYMNPLELDVVQQTLRHTGSGGRFADGGIGTREINNATLFEGDKKEAVIPLESQTGIDFLAEAMQKAGGSGAGSAGGSSQIVVNLSLDGLNVAENEESWRRVGTKIAEIIDIERQRRGELNYGGNF